MADTHTRRVLRLVLGDEGTVATESGMQVVMVSMALAVAGVYAMSPILSALSGPFGVTDARMGAIITAYMAPSVVLVPVVGVLADRLGRRRLLVGGLVCFGVGGTAAALTTDFTVVLALRALQGVGFAAINPLSVTVIGDLYSGSEEATAQGLRVAGIQVSALAVPPVAGALVLLAWQLPFLLYAVALPTAAWAWVTLPESNPSGDPPAIRAYLGELVTLLRQPPLAAIQLSFLVRFSLSYGYYAYISVLLVRTLGSSTVETGFVVSGAGLVALVSTTQVGRFVATRNDLLVLVAGLVAVGVGLVVMGSTPTYLAVGVGAVTLGFGLGVSGPIQKSLVTRLAPDSLRAGAVSSALLFQSLGQATGPLAVGLLVVWYGPATAFVAFGGVGAVLGAGLILAAYRWSGGGTVD